MTHPIRYEYESREKRRRIWLIRIEDAIRTGNPLRVVLRSDATVWIPSLLKMDGDILEILFPNAYTLRLAWVTGSWTAMSDTQVTVRLLSSCSCGAFLNLLEPAIEDLVTTP